MGWKPGLNNTNDIKESHVLHLTAYRYEALPAMPPWNKDYYFILMVDLIGFTSKN